MSVRYIVPQLTPSSIAYKHLHFLVSSRRRPHLHRRVPVPLTGTVTHCPYQSASLSKSSAFSTHNNSSIMSSSSTNESNDKTVVSARRKHGGISTSNSVMQHNNNNNNNSNSEKTATTTTSMKATNASNKIKKKTKKHTPSINTGGRRPVATHFVGIQINEKCVVQRLCETQSKLQSVYPPLHDHEIDPVTFHFTLNVIAAPTADGEHQLKQMFHECATQISEALCDDTADTKSSQMQSDEKCTLAVPLQGIASFGPRVIYANIPETRVTRRLRLVYQFLNTKIEECGLIQLNGDRWYQPHVTLNKVRFGKKNKRKLEAKHVQNALDQIGDVVFGEQPITQLQLLRMRRVKHNNKFGYYSQVCAVDIASGGIIFPTPPSSPKKKKKRKQSSKTTTD
jgi:2'-5' RNA ligase